MVYRGKKNLRKHLMILHLRLHVRLYLISNIIYVDFVQLLNVDRSIFYSHGIICINLIIYTF